MVIKELVIEDEFDGVSAISLVKEPAIERNFVLFGDNETYYEYVLNPEFSGEPLLMDNSHEHCKHHAGKQFSVSEIRNWNTDGEGFTPEAQQFFQNFPDEGYNLNMALYNCRHYLRRVRRLSFNSNIVFSVSNEEKKEIEGVVLVANKMIYRNDIDGYGEGYVYFSNDTVRKLQKQYGYSKNSTLYHMENISGYMIMLNSWLEEEKGNVIWKCRYKVLSDKLWQVIKTGEVKGFSIEVFISPKK